MAVELAFLIKDLEPNEGMKDTVGVIALVNKGCFSLEKLLEDIEDAFSYELLLDRNQLANRPTLHTGVEEVNGVLVGCIYMRDNHHACIDDIATAVIDKHAWSGTIGSPQAVAAFINQKADEYVPNPVGEWKGFFNNPV